MHNILSNNKNFKKQNAEVNIGKTSFAMCTKEVFCLMGLNDLDDIQLLFFLAVLIDEISIFYYI